MADQLIYILLADDDLEDQDILKNAVTGLNAALVVNTVSNGQEAIQYLHDRAAGELPSLLILDYKMPILTAVDVLEKLQGDPRYTQMPKVVWSTSYQDDHIKLCMDRGATHYFKKPFNSTELVTIAKKMIACIPELS
jgi:CheY-like chemotaxis protein